MANWTVETWGPNWRVDTDYYYFRWDDFVAADMAESDWWRFPLGIAALFEFILTGTAIKYFIVAWRYGGFFLYPCSIAGMVWLSIPRRGSRYHPGCRIISCSRRCSRSPFSSRCG